MAIDEDKRSKPLRAPASTKGRERVRALAEAGASLIPGGGAVARVLRATNPPKSEQYRKEWQNAITERTNQHGQRLDEHEQQLAPTRTLTGIPVRLVAALAEDCPDGLGQKKYGLSDLSALLPDANCEAVEDAVFDLEHFGLLRLDHTIGGHWWARLAPSFYTQIDQQLMGWSPEEDACSLAQLMLENGEGRAAQLHEASGWSTRRFNPAFRVLLSHFPSGRVSRERQPHYVAASVALLPEDRSRLRRILDGRG